MKNGSYIRAPSPQWMQGGQNAINMFNASGYSSNIYPNMDQIYTLVKRLTLGPNERAEALHTLSVQREQIPNLAFLLWESPGTITALLTEILSIYPHLTSVSASSNSAPASLSSRLATRVCNVLALFQCVAGHEKTRIPFIKANIPMYLFPFLHTTNQSRECECFKLTSLGIIGSLVKAEDHEIIQYLLQNEFIPLCLRILKFGQEMSRIVAAFIVQKILSDKEGRLYVVSSSERLDTVLKVLNVVICNMASNYNQRLSKNIIASYDCLLQEPAVREKVATMGFDNLRKVQIPPSYEDLYNFVQKLLKIERQ
ncbi:hypothetical protein GPJ56_001323 [Histomonas meleagridis]|uniref:uncharacterized protein n=1 Tax=Histomonas meleagridis TaxID=135588 RepID=UPI003559EAD4|nr:hypothetical protein GPJ56_001323 [Histomonas meleagridis]KAH0805080.1 hypothetical protein GO595_002025 [Histomonas meleagridis]